MSADEALDDDLDAVKSASDAARESAPKARGVVAPGVPLLRGVPAPGVEDDEDVRRVGGRSGGRRRGSGKSKLGGSSSSAATATASSMFGVGTGDGEVAIATAEPAPARGGLLADDVDGGPVAFPNDFLVEDAEDALVSDPATECEPAELAGLLFGLEDPPVEVFTGEEEIAAAFAAFRGFEDGIVASAVEGIGAGFDGAGARLFSSARRL
ncbi:hypothetical protein HK101_004812 [Irineochytrium annulatum]|nr:hypothetical protein HK101_004812 [Irineochytrium annulatum]